jgi:hypothetical protein
MKCNGANYPSVTNVTLKKKMLILRKPTTLQKTPSIDLPIEGSHYDRARVWRKCQRADATINKPRLRNKVTVGKSNYPNNTTHTYCYQLAIR